jgi:hypothetical protein
MRADGAVGNNGEAHRLSPRSAPIKRRFNKERCAHQRKLRDVTNHPVCASEESKHFLMAQPPRLAKAGTSFLCMPTHLAF